MDTSPDLGKKRGNPEEPEPATEGKRDRISYEDVDLTKYIETRYVSKNKNLKRILAPLESGDLPDKSIEIIEPLIRSNDWKSFDGFCEAHQGVENFWDILQCLFYLRYFAEPIKIDFDQMQKAMGIQQARWSVDPANECYQFLKENYEANGSKDYPTKENDFYSYFLKNIISFKYFHELSVIQRNKIVEDIFGHIFNLFTLKDQLEEDYIKSKKAEEQYEILLKIQNIEPNIKAQIKSALHDRIFYQVAYNSHRNFPWELGYDWSKSPSNYDVFLGIPQTYDLTSVTCFHKPILVFGALRPKTMVNFIIKNDMRPFAAHLPGSTVNLTQFDGADGGLVHNWRHDLYHQSRNHACDVRKTIEKAEKLCTGEGDLPGINDGREAWLTNERFQNCLEKDRDEERYKIDKSYKALFAMDETKSIAEPFLDSGNIYGPNYIRDFDNLLKPPLEKGGKKTKRRRNRKTRGKKQKRSRKHR
jgi:hypothetical protein